MVKDGKKSLEKELKKKEEEKPKEKKIKVIEKEEDILVLGREGSNKIQVSEDEFDENNPLSQFLSNPWKQVSFEASGESVLNLDNLPQREVEEDEENPVDYMVSKGSEEGMYVAPGRDSNMEFDWKSSEEKLLDDQKRLYSRTKMSDDKEDEYLGKDYVAMKDFVKRDYVKPEGEVY
jgi:hypothetical protein